MIGAKIAALSRVVNSMVGRQNVSPHFIPMLARDLRELATAADDGITIPTPPPANDRGEARQ